MILAILGALSLLLAGNIVTQTLISHTNQTISTVINVNGEKLTLLNQLKNISDNREIALLNMLLLDEEMDNFDDKIAHYNESLKKSAAVFGGILDRFDTIPLQAEEREIFDRLRAAAVTSRQSFGSLITAINVGFMDEAQEVLHNEFAPNYKKFLAVIDQFSDYEIKQNSDAISALYSMQELNSNLLWLGLLISIILLLVGGFIIVRSLLRPINALRDTMVTIGQTGDLNYRVQEFGNDEITVTVRAINSLLEDIHLSTIGVGGVLKDIAEGEFDSRVEGNLKGDFLRMKESVNLSAGQISSVMSILETTANNFRSGILEVEKDHSVQLSGKYITVLHGLDRSAIRMKETIVSIAETLTSLSKGDFTVRSKVEVRGDFISLQSSLNITLGDLDRFVAEVTEVQTALSQGDLTTRVTGSYRGKMSELKDSLNLSINNTSSMVAQVSVLTTAVSAGAEEMGQGNNDISQRFTQQAAALEQTSNSMEEMTSSVRQNADNSSQANQQTIKAQTQLKSGLESMEHALSSVASMSEASQKINDIISIIDSIAFQTNLLALNAAVEAARAGEHGRGFAVVAGEVRNLAGKSAEAAKQIKGLIENSVQVSEQSSRYVQQTSDAMTAINSSMSEVSEMVSDISEATSEQAEGIDQVNAAVLSMDDLTQKNALVIHSVEESSHELLEHVASLREEVGKFRVSQSNSVQLTS